MWICPFDVFDVTKNKIKKKLKESLQFIRRNVTKNNKWNQLYDHDGMPEAVANDEFMEIDEQKKTLKCCFKAHGFHTYRR